MCNMPQITMVCWPRYLQRALGEKSSYQQGLCGEDKWEDRGVHLPTSGCPRPDLYPCRDWVILSSGMWDGPPVSDGLPMVQPSIALRS
jgi:hypothetical protein